MAQDRARWIAEDMHTGWTYPFKTKPEAERKAAHIRRTGRNAKVYMVPNWVYFY